MSRALSASRCARRKKRRQLMVSLPGSGTQNAADAIDQPLPPGSLCRESLSSGGGEAIVFCLSIVLGGSPKGDDIGAVFQTVQGWIQRAMFHLQDFARTPLNGVSDRMPVGRPEQKCLDDQHIEGTLQHVSLGLWGSWHD